MILPITSTSAGVKCLQQAVKIDSRQNWAKDATLVDPVGDPEILRGSTRPLNPHPLSHAPAYQKTNNGLGHPSFQQFLKLDAVVNSIKGFRCINQTSIHFRTLIQVTIDNSFHDTSTQGSGAARFEAKL